MKLVWVCQVHFVFFVCYHVWLGLVGFNLVGQTDLLICTWSALKACVKIKFSCVCVRARVCARARVCVCVHALASTCMLVRENRSLLSSFDQMTSIIPTLGALGSVQIKDKRKPVLGNPVVVCRLKTFLVCIFSRGSLLNG